MLLFLHAIAHWCHLHKVPLVPYAIKMFVFVAFRCILYPEASIGKGTRLRRQGWCIGIFPGAVIGRDCTIYNRVEIAHGNIDLDMRNTEANPVGIVIGDRVSILPGAKILCKSGILSIGEDSIIGANAVVLSDVPPNSVVVGIPGRSIPRARPVLSA
jgi:serine O-acetyltransferase